MYYVEMYNNNEGGSPSIDRALDNIADRVTRREPKKKSKRRTRQHNGENYHAETAAEYERDNGTEIENIILNTQPNSQHNGHHQLPQHLQNWDNSREEYPYASPLLVQLDTYTADNDTIDKMLENKVGALIDTRESDPCGMDHAYYSQERMRIMAQLAGADPESESKALYMAEGKQYIKGGALQKIDSGAALDHSLKFEQSVSDQNPHQRTVSNVGMSDLKEVDASEIYTTGGGNEIKGIWNRETEKVMQDMQNDGIFQQERNVILNNFNSYLEGKQAQMAYEGQNQEEA